MSDTTMKLAAVLAFALGLAGFASCDAPTFTCVEYQSPANPGGCYCKADGITCDDWGDCIAACPVD